MTTRQALWSTGKRDCLGVGVGNLTMNPGLEVIFLCLEFSEVT